MKMQKNINRIISIICKLALILSALCSLPAFNVFAESEDGLVADSGFEVGKKIAELDPTNSLLEGWSLHENSVVTNSPENDGTNKSTITMYL